MSAVDPSEDSATLLPNSALVASSVGTILDPVWVQAPLDRVNTHAAPLLELSMLAPISAVLPSAEIAALKPKLLPTPFVCSSLGTSLLPCWSSGSMVSG